MKRFIKFVKRAKAYASHELTQFMIMRRVGKLIMPQYRFKWHQLGWWHNQQFNHYLEKFNELKGMNTDRRWMVSQLLRLVEVVAGDTAECGVFRGSSSFIICQSNQENKNIQRTHFIFDSFEGLSPPTNLDGKHWTEGNLSCGMVIVKKNLARFSNISWHKGWIPEGFADIEDKTFAFVHIDVDLYEPTRDSIHHFYPRMNTGGIILCDDYGCTTCPGATKAIDEFLLDKPEKMISLCCGGGFMIKGCQTANQLQSL
jgi:O-methyltransferase